MIRLADLVSIGLLVAAVGSFGAGLYVLAEQRDLLAIYWLVIGLSALRASTNILRPKVGSR
jgi:hypothetical protein